jgi:hypothetical protein
MSDGGEEGKRKARREVSQRVLYEHWPSPKRDMQREIWGF